MIVKLVVLIISFFIILNTLNIQEKFTLKIPNPISSNKNYGIHTMVDVNDYDLNYYGPKCLNTCIVEHVQKINWEESLKSDSKYANKNILQYNRDNPDKNYCHLANKNINKKSHIKSCDSDCNNTCENDSLYSHCKNISNYCEEKNINYLSGYPLLNKIKCSGGSIDNHTSSNCVNKYWENIQTLKNSNDNFIN